MIKVNSRFVLITSISESFFLFTKNIEFLQFYIKITLACQRSLHTNVQFCLDKAAREIKYRAANLIIN